MTSITTCPGRNLACRSAVTASPYGIARMTTSLPAAGGSTVRLPDSADRGVRQTGNRDALRECTAGQHCGRSTVGAVPGHDRPCGLCYTATMGATSASWHRHLGELLEQRHCGRGKRNRAGARLDTWRERLRTGVERVTWRARELSRTGAGDQDSFNQVAYASRGGLEQSAPLAFLSSSVFMYSPHAMRTVNFSVRTTPASSWGEPLSSRLARLPVRVGDCAKRDVSLSAGILGAARGVARALLGRVPGGLFSTWRCPSEVSVRTVVEILAGTPQDVSGRYSVLSSSYGLNDRRAQTCFWPLHGECRRFDPVSTH